MLNELNLKLLLSNRTEPSDTKVQKLRNFIKLIYKHDVEISFEEALVFPKLESLQCSSDVRLRKLSAQILCKLVKTNPTLYSEINNLPLINGKLTITQPGFIKQDLLSNFLNGIQLQQSQSLSMNSKHIFHHLSLNSKDVKINTVNRSHYYNFVNDGAQDYMPDPISSIIWVEYNTLDLRRGEKVGFEQSTKTHFTTMESNENDIIQQNGYDSVIDKVLRANSRTSNQNYAELSLSELRKSAHRKKPGPLTNPRQPDLKPITNLAILQKRRSKESSFNKLINKAEQKVQMNNKIFTDSIEEKDIMYKIKNLGSSYGKRINHSINNSIEYSAAKKKPYDNPSPIRNKSIINKPIFDQISQKDKITKSNTYNLNESITASVKRNYKYLFKEKRKKGINDLEKSTIINENQKRLDAIYNSVDYGQNKSINLLKDRQKLTFKMNRRENSPCMRQNTKASSKDKISTTNEQHTIKPGNKNYILRDLSLKSIEKNNKNGFFATKRKK